MRQEEHKTPIPRPSEESRKAYRDNRGHKTISLKTYFTNENMDYLVANKGDQSIAKLINLIIEKERLANG